MKLLRDILYKVTLQAVHGSTNLAISHVSFDSRNIKKDTLFIAIEGTQSDGHQYISGAIAQGAVAIVCKHMPQVLNESVTYVLVQDTSEALGRISCNYFDNPSTQFKLIGITGTNGKTTTATLLFDVFTLLGYTCGLISTVENRIGKAKLPSTHTTPNAFELNALLHEMAQKRCTYVFMEVSSHAQAQKRTWGLEFTGAIFSNLTRDHLDYHVTFDAYRDAKKSFFDQLGSQAFALINSDDANGTFMLQNTKAKSYTYALHHPAHFNSRILEQHVNGTLLRIDQQDVWIKLIGEFNAYNILAIYACAILLKQDKTNVLSAISQVKSVTGRFQYIEGSAGRIGIVDYAHTPDALLNVLQTIQGLKQPDQKIITVIGCGGDRDKGKRPLMAEIAFKYSDTVVFTSDNPRTEHPDQIIDDMMKGVPPGHIRDVLRNTSRAAAIQTACALLKPGDIVLVAGKGHEAYQDIAGEKFAFSDIHELQNHLHINP